MRTITLPIIVTAPRGQRYSCHSCGACCRDFTVQLRDEDLARLDRQGWARERGEPVTVEFRGRRFLRQRADGSCVFLQPDGRCEIHARHGLQEKPVACRFFPFSVVPEGGRAVAGLNFACQSVQRSIGAEPKSHGAELRRMCEDAPELLGTAGAARRHPSIAGWGRDMLHSLDGEVECVEQEALGLLAHPGLPFSLRLGSLGILAGSLLQARLDAVRGDRFVLLAQALAGAAPEEARRLGDARPTRSQWALLRGAVHLRTHSPKLDALRADGWLRTTIRDLSHARRWRRGRGDVPRFRALDSLATASLPFSGVICDRPTPAAGTRAAIDDLLTRWLQSRILGARCWGAGYYGWSAVEGLGALVVDALAVLWLAQLHASASQSGTRVAAAVTLDGVAWSLGQVERTAGRVPWLATSAEHLRMRALSASHGFCALSNGLLWRPSAAGAEPAGSLQ